MSAAGQTPPKGDGYRGILKATSLIGGASVLNVLIGMVRTKFVAVLLGPTGVGLLGIYVQITTLASTVAGMGIAISGVRQVAEAVATDDKGRVARTVVTLRRTAWATGLLGMAALALLAHPISLFSFATAEHAGEVALLGATVLLGSISAGQSCLLRGMRRISDVARLTVVGALATTAVAIPCFYLWALDGVVPALLLGGVVTLASSWWYARRVPVQASALSLADTWSEARALLSLGFSLMVSGLVTAGATYLIQILLVRRFGIGAAGLYQAAFSLSGVLIGFVLGAMGADYYPRLTGASGDDQAVRRMVNEQSQISILLALPALAAMMVFSPLVIRLFFDPRFEAAIPILRWCVLGMLGRVLSWPLGFVLLARGKGRIFFATELGASVLHVAAVLGLSTAWGLEGAGLAFMVLYVCYTALMLGIVRSQLGGSWTGETTAIALAATAALATLQAVRVHGVPPFLQVALDVAVLGATSCYSGWRLLRHYRSG